MQIAVVGLGRWGRHLARNFHALGVLAAVVDSDQDCVKHFSNLYQTSIMSFDQACQSQSIDALVLAVPVEAHVHMAKEALKYGKHVWVEKPLCLQEVDARALQDLAKRNRRHIFIDYLPVYHPAIAYLKSQNIDLNSIHNICTQRKAWGVWREEGVLWDLICHDLAVLLHLWPEATVSAVCASGLKLSEKNAFCDQVSVHLMMNTVPIHLQVSCMSLKKVQSIEIVGLNQGWLVDFQAQTVLSQLDLKYSPMEMSPVAVSLASKEPLLLAAEAFVDAVKYDKPMLTSIDFAIKVENVIRLIHQEIKLQTV